MAETAPSILVQPDRVGIGWRGELAAGILAHLDRIDLLEIIADDGFRAARRELRALSTLASQAPITLHGVSMGLAGSEPTATRRMDAMARLVDMLQPENWSEHLAFVRAGGIEIGHLAAPPRTQRSVDAAIANIERATRIVGRAPLMENIATLIDPPASTLDEATWTADIVTGADVGLLLDLHNLYANALNFRMDPAELLSLFPLHRVRTVHLSGGRWIPEPRAAMDSRQPSDSGNESADSNASKSVDGGTPVLSPRMRLLDDHVHDVPHAVFDLLALLAQRTPQRLDVIIERDGAYPDFDTLLAQMDSARKALRLGRASARETAAIATCEAA